MGAQDLLASFSQRFSSVSTVPYEYSRKKLRKPPFSPLLNFSARICTKSLLFEYSITNNEIALLQHLVTMESLLLYYNIEICVPGFNFSIN